MRQEGHEFAVMALLELRRINVEVVDKLEPGIGPFALIEILPGRLDPSGIALIGAVHRHQLKGPHQDLPEVPDDRVGETGHGVTPLGLAESLDQ